jgi:hypothetical protein
MNKQQALKILAVALMAQGLIVLGCSSSTPSEGTGGTTGGSVGGAPGGGTGGGMGCGMAGPIPDPGNPGSCICGSANPDSAPGGACASDCQSVSCGKICNAPCCVPCGIDAAGAKVCTCTNPGVGPYTNCTCSPSADIPPNLHGGLCSPQGYSTATVPATAPAGSISLRGMPCKVTSPLTVCFTADSNPSSERGCICKADGMMHCNSVNHWFINDLSLATPWMP